MEPIKKLATVLWMIVGYPIGLICLGIYFSEYKLGVLIAALFFLGLPTLLLYVVFIKPSKLRKAELKAALQFYSEMNSELTKLKDVTPEELKKLDITNTDYRLVRGETFLGVQYNVKRIELKSTGRYSSRGTSISIPIYKGIRYRVGNGSIAPQKEMMVTAQGRIIITTAAFVFEGNDKNERINWTQIADIDIFPDGITVKKRDGSPRNYGIESFLPVYAALITKLLQ